MKLGLLQRRYLEIKIPHLWKTSQKLAGKKVTLTPYGFFEKTKEKEGTSLVKDTQRVAALMVAKKACGLSGMAINFERTTPSEIRDLLRGSIRLGDHDGLQKRKSDEITDPFIITEVLDGKLPMEVLGIPFERGEESYLTSLTLPNLIRKLCGENAVPLYSGFLFQAKDFCDYAFRSLTLSALVSSLFFVGFDLLFPDIINGMSRDERMRHYGSIIIPSLAIPGLAGYYKLIDRRSCLERELTVRGIRLLATYYELLVYTDKKAEAGKVERGFVGLLNNKKELMDIFRQFMRIKKGIEPNPYFIFDRKTFVLDLCNSQTREYFALLEKRKEF